MTVQAVKAISVLGAVVATLATGDALADGHGHGHGPLADYVYARVVDVDPVVRYVTVDRPEQRCWNETVARPVGSFGSWVRPRPAASSARRSATSWAMATRPA